MKKDVLLQALHGIALKRIEGGVSTDMLIKACDAYKLKTEFDEGYDYHVIVSKSIYDQLNGVPQDEELCKAILPGQTTVIDGVLYVWEPTKVGSVTQYGWHVAQKNIGKGGSLTAQRIAQLEKEANDMFPSDADLSKLKVINNNIGGSTGAQLVEDVRGNRYIMKKGTNVHTNNDHVINEYLCNQLYDLAGIKTPNYHLYNQGGTAVLLSCYIPNARPIQTKDYPTLAKNFLYDCLFANWDAYQNSDNCLIDSQGNLVHVDNGGTLNFRAHGALKPFDGDIMDTFASMQKASPNIAQLLDDDDLLNQIAAIRAKRADLVNYLKEVGETALAKTIGDRIDNLRLIEQAINRKKNGGNLSNHKVLPRKLKPKKEMYREFTDAELKAIFNTQKGNGVDRVTAKDASNGKPGHLMLSEVCKARGFDARGRVVDDAEYQKIVEEAIKNGESVQLLRGLSPNTQVASKGKITIEEAVQSLLYDDNCFYGTQAAYGAGIYAHLNDGNGVGAQSQSKYKGTHAYDHAIEYAQEGGKGKGAIVKMTMEPDAKIIDYNDLIQEMRKNLTPDADPKAIDKCEKELKDLEKKLRTFKDTVDKYESKVIEDAYKQIKYDANAWTAFGVLESSVDWGKKDAFGDRDIPPFDEFVGKEISDLVRANGGKVTTKKGVYVFSFPELNTEFSISEYQYDGPYSIKRPNINVNAYNYSIVRFCRWFESTKVQQAEDAKRDALNNVVDGKKKLVSQMNKLQSDYDAKERELYNLMHPGTDIDENKGIYEAIYKASVSGSHTGPIGLYAALKGYDAIKKEHGNGSNNSFYIILNRSKLIINKNVDWNV